MRYDDWYWDEQTEREREREQWRHEARYQHDADADGDGDGPRASYVVLVDGRVIDNWSEPLAASPWRNDPSAVQPTVSPYRDDTPQLSENERVINWLERAVGGVTALAHLDDEPLPDEPFDLPFASRLTSHQRAAVLAAASMVDEVADRFFDPEVRTAMRRALAGVCEKLLLGSQPSTTANAVAAVVWAVAKGNDLVGPGRRATMKAIAALLGVPSLPTEKGREVARLLRRSGWGSSDTPWQLRELEQLGQPGLLIAQTRRTLIATRDAALVAVGREAERELAREQARALGREQARLMAGAMFDSRQRTRYLQRHDDDVHEAMLDIDEESVERRADGVVYPDNWTDLDDDPEFHGRASA